MSTALAEPSAPTVHDAPASLSAMLYGTPSEPTIENPVEKPSSAPSPENGTAASAQEGTPSAGTVKPDPQPDTEAEHLKAEIEKAKAAESRQAKSAMKLGRDVQELKSQLAQVAEENRILKAKMDGTYEEPQGPTPEQIQAQAEFRGRELASLEVAKQRYGAEQVEERIYAQGSELKQLLQAEPEWQLAIARNPQPTVKAWQILELKQFQDKYGEDSSVWVEKILAEHKPKLMEEFKKTLSVTPTGAPAPTVTQARGDGGPSPKSRSLADLMYGAPPRA